MAHKLSRIFAPLGRATVNTALFGGLPYYKALLEVFERFVRYAIVILVWVNTVRVRFF
jgi:hypothetical protein